MRACTVCNRCQSQKSFAFRWRRDSFARIDATLLRRQFDPVAALPFLAKRPDFCVAPKNGLTIGPGKRRGNLAGVADGRASRRLIAQVRPLKVEGVSAL